MTLGPLLKYKNPDITIREALWEIIGTHTGPDMPGEGAQDFLIAQARHLEHTIMSAPAPDAGTLAWKLSYLGELAACMDLPSCRPSRYLPVVLTDIARLEAEADGREAA